MGFTRNFDTGTKIEEGECHFYQYRQSGEVVPKLDVLSGEVEYIVKVGDVNSEGDIIVSATVLETAGGPMPLSVPIAVGDQLGLNQEKIFTLFIRGKNLLNSYLIMIGDAEILTRTKKELSKLPTSDDSGECVHMMWTL